MKIKIAQFNPRVGDLKGNYDKAVEIMKNPEADLVVFPELSVMGYPPKDLLEKPAFVKAVEDYNQKWIALSATAGIVFGSALSLKHADPPKGQTRRYHPGKPLENVAIVADKGAIIGSQAKTLLPTYDVFDEARYFRASNTNIPVEFRGQMLGISICEDIWNDKQFWKEQRLYSVDPIRNLDDAGFDIMINISASPFALGKPTIRMNMLSHLAKKYDKPFIYVNQVGGNDDVIYDGQSMAIRSDGTTCKRLQSFVEDMAIIDTDHLIGESRREFVLTDSTPEPQQIYKALVLGTRDYAHKTGFTKAVLGLSGGIDSALVACIAAEAFGRENVLGIGMPSKYSSEGSVSDAERIAQKLGINFGIIPIREVHEAYMQTMLPVFGEPTDVELWEENIQARSRGAILMAISNRESRLLLTTGNKSEVAVGYCTLYGDTCGGLAVIADVFKTKVYDVCKWFNKHRGEEIIPEGSINKPPSAELRPNQTDQQSLPPYDFLDQILGMYIEEAMEIDEIIAHLEEHHSQVPAMPTPESIAKICRMVDRNEYKRRQLAPGLKITRKAFGTGRQMPIAQGWR